MKRAISPIGFLFIISLGLGLFIYQKQSQIKQLQAQHTIEIAELTKKNKLQAQEKLTKHRKMMADNALISGKSTQEAHQKEWSSRSSYESYFAKTPREKTILKIIALSKNKSLSDQEILQRVTTLAAPKNSKIEVTETLNSFRVFVIFDMSDMTSGEEGSSTKHTSIESLQIARLDLRS